MKWNQYTTNTFKVSNGVKQGGILSPVLFTLYIDELLIRLNKSGLGCDICHCYICHIFAGAFECADDVTMLSSIQTIYESNVTDCVVVWYG